MPKSVTGHLEKMLISLSASPALPISACEDDLLKANTKGDFSTETAQYSLRVGEHNLPLNECINKPIRLEFLGKISCRHCGKSSRSSYAQGYCFTCMRTLAECDLCIMSPERCHYHEGTCRDPAWGEKFCMQDHVVYLANSSGLKVGITRLSQLPTRWLDQGAIQGLPILKTSNRKLAGEIECIFKAHISDKTNWRHLLHSDAQFVDLVEQKQRLKTLAVSHLVKHLASVSLHTYTWLDGPEFTPVNISYPIHSYPNKVVTHNLDKEPVLEDCLIGIKGQYLMFAQKVINIRKYTSYLLKVTL